MTPNPFRRVCRRRGALRKRKGYRRFLKASRSRGGGLEEHAKSGVVWYEQIITRRSSSSSGATRRSCQRSVRQHPLCDQDPYDPMAIQGARSVRKRYRAFIARLEESWRPQSRHPRVVLLQRRFEKLCSFIMANPRR
jgi:hypothetical protein